jgi:hypothetical protein
MRSKSVNRAASSYQSKLAANASSLPLGLTELLAWSREVTGHLLPEPLRTLGYPIPRKVDLACSDSGEPALKAFEQLLRAAHRGLVMMSIGTVRPSHQSPA